MSHEKIPKGYQAHLMKNSDGNFTAVMYTTEIDINKKGGNKKMSKETAKPKTETKAKPQAQPTAKENRPFVSYPDMTDRERGIFFQGQNAKEKQIKEKMGMFVPKKQK